MTDTPPPAGPTPENEDTPPPASSPEEDAARQKRNEELFGDLDGEETLEDVQAERNELLQKLADLGSRLGKLQQDNLTLTRQMATQKEEAAAALSRTQKQVEEQKAFVLEKFVKDILPVVDNLERGLSAIPADQRSADPKFDKLAQGVEKTLGQLTAIFNKFGIKEIEAQGQTFDPSKHEAISMQDDPEAESETVLAVTQKGYELNGRIIRPAKVVVKP